MEYIRIPLSVKCAAGTPFVGNVCPSNATERWKLKELGFMPNVTSATDGSNYATARAYSDTGTGTAICAARTTNSSGGSALTAGTFEAIALTGTPTQLECTSTQPLHIDVAHTGTGVAVDVTAVLLFERMI